MRFVDPTKPDANEKVVDESNEVSFLWALSLTYSSHVVVLMNLKLASFFHSIVSTFYQMEFEKDKDTKERDEDEEKVKSSENVSIKGGESSEKLPLSDEDDDDDEDDDRNNTDSKSSSAPGTDDKKKKPWVSYWIFPEASKGHAWVLGRKILTLSWVSFNPFLPLKLRPQNLCLIKTVKNIKRWSETLKFFTEPQIILTPFRSLSLLQNSCLRLVDNFLALGKLVKARF